MNSHGKFNIFSNNKTLSGIYTVIFLFILFAIQLFNVVDFFEDADIWLTISMTIGLCIFCFIFCLLGVNAGKRFSRKPIFGGLLGGFAGLIAYISFLVGLVVLMASMAA